MRPFHLPFLLGYAAARTGPWCSGGIPPNATKIPRTAFQECDSLEVMKIPNNVTSIGDYAFRNCRSLKSVEIPGNVTSIGDWAFDGCSSLKSMEIPSSVASIGIYSFFNCRSLESVEILGSGTSIGIHAFESCSSLQSVKLPSSLASIGNATFRNCYSLKSVEIPRSVTSIGRAAFSGCMNLSSVSVPAKISSSSVGVQAFPAETQISGGFVDNQGVFHSCQGGPQQGLVYLGVGLALSLVLLASQAAVGTEQRQREALIASAMKAEFLGTLQVLQLLGDAACLPKALKQLLRVLRKLRPEGLHAACAMKLDGVTQSHVTAWGLPLALLAGQGMLFLIGLLISQLQGRAPKTAERAGRHMSAWLVSLYWLFPTLLAAAYRPLFEAPDANQPLTLSRSWWPWLSLLACQGCIPVVLVAAAHSPSMAAATAPFRQEWRRPWMCLVLLRSMAIAEVTAVTDHFARILANDLEGTLTEVPDPSSSVLFIIVSYSALLACCRPYQAHFITALDGALLYSVLASELTKFSFAGAVMALRETYEEKYYGAEKKGLWCMYVVEALILLMVAVGALLLLRALALDFGCCRGHGSREEKAQGGPRQDLGTFEPGAAQAVISAPGQAPRSWNVRLGRGQEARKALLLGSGRPPMLQKEKQYKIRFRGGEEAEVAGAELRFDGDPEYEFWNEAVNHAHYLQGFSFACVWVPGIAGHFRPAPSFRAWLEGLEDSQMAAEPEIGQELWSRYQQSLPWVCRQLAEGYRSKHADPPCCNCAWFDFWAINVMRCWQDGQRLRFAYLQEPLKPDQPQFLCQGKGHYVGIAQKVELAWAQDQMQMVLEPIAVSDFLGAEDEELRIAGGAIEAAGGVSSALHKRLQPLLQRRRAAKLRRMHHRCALLLLPLMPLSLAALSFVRAAYILGGVSLALVLAAWLGAPWLMRGLGDLFTAEDRREDDLFYDDLHQRLQATVEPRSGEAFAAREVTPLLLQL